MSVAVTYGDNQMYAFILIWSLVLTEVLCEEPSFGHRFGIILGANVEKSFHLPRTSVGSASG